MHIILGPLGRIIVTMFNAEIIKARLNKQPFRPFQINLSEGLSYEINHPDLVLVGWTNLHIGFAKPENPTIYYRTLRVEMDQVVGLEDLPGPTPQNG